MIDCNEFPQVSGLYFLYDNDSLLYIGRSANIRKRLKAHQKGSGVKIIELVVSTL